MQMQRVACKGSDQDWRVGDITMPQELQGYQLMSYVPRASERICLTATEYNLSAAPGELHIRIGAASYAVEPAA